MPERAATFSCPGCRKRYAWKPEIAGRKVRCNACNLKVRIPALGGGPAEALEPLPPAPGHHRPANDAPPPAPKPQYVRPDHDPADDYDSTDGDDDAGTLELQTQDDHGPSGGARCPSCGQKVKPGAIICINCGFNLKAGKRITTAVESPVDDDEAGKPGGAPAAGGAPALDSERWNRLVGQARTSSVDNSPSDFKEKWMPLVLIGVGVLLVLLDAFVLMYAEANYIAGRYGAGDEVAARISRIIQAGMYVVLGMPFMFLGLVIVAKLFSSAYGGMLTALYKLAGVLVLTTGAGQVFGSIMDRLTGGVGDFIGMLSLVVDLGAFWLGCALTFDDMEPMEVMVLFFLVRLLPWIVVGLLLMTVLSAFM